MEGRSGKSEGMNEKAGSKQAGKEGKGGWAGKVLKCRWLWSIAGTLLILYFYLGIHGGARLFENIGIYFDGIIPLLLGGTVLLVLYMSGMVKDFARGFRMAFTGRGEEKEIKRAVKAFGCAERTAVTAGVILLMTGTMDMLSSVFYNYNGAVELYLVLNIPLGILAAYCMYPALFLLVMTPVKSRLKGLEA